MPPFFMRKKGIGVVVITWLLQLFFCLPAWIGGHIFDEYFFFIHHPFLNTLLTFAFIGFLLLLLISKSAKTLYYCLAVVILLLLCMCNINLIQPWQWVNLFLLGCLVFKQEQLILLILSGLYFWSGLNKINSWFQTEIFNWFFSPILNEKLQSFYWIIPAIEFSSAIFLLFPKTRKKAALVCVFKHLFVAVLLSPLFHDWNYVVIPWNIGLAALLFVFYCKPAKSNYVLQRIKTIEYIIILFFWLAPSLWYIGAWPYNLSFHLYSGYHSTTYLFTEKGRKLEIEQYHIENYGIPLYINDYNLQQIKKRIIKKHKEVIIKHFYKQPFTTKKKLKTF